MDFRDIDDALYRHERPYYRACAGGAYFEVTKQWIAERERLTKLWFENHPLRDQVVIQDPEPTLWQQIKKLFK